MYDDVRRLLARWKNQRKKGELLWRFKAAKRCYGKGCGYTTSHKSTGDRSRRVTTDVRLLLSETQGPKLTSIPRGLYHYIDKQGRKTKKYRPGSKWCYKCRASCYKQPGLPVNERRKITFTYEKCIKAHITIIPPQLSKTSKLNIVFIKYCRKTKKRNG